MKYNWKNEKDINDFSIRVYEKYLEKVKIINHRHFFRFTGYFRFIFHAICILSNKSFFEYTKLLEKISLDLRRAIHSWDHDELAKYFSNWFYWVISAKLFIDRKSIEMDIMPSTCALLKDERLFLNLNCDVNGQQITFNKGY